MINSNNPENLQLSNSYSTISATLNNPFVSKPIQYGDFRSSDPVLNSLLPKKLNLGKDNGNANNGNDLVNKNNQNINLGITSPGYIDNAMNCTGLDFISTNPNIDKLPFQTCLNKFTKQYEIPEMVLNNLMNNLPYTFSALSPSEKKRYLNSLQNFIDTQLIKNRNIQDSKNNHDNNNDDDNKNNIEYFGNTGGGSTNEKCSNNGLSLSGLLSIVIIIIIVLIFILFIANKN